VIEKVTETDRVLASMFTENTGKHFLDSGGAYGRNWERNQGKLPEDFLDAPEAEIEVWGSDDWYVSANTFHFLRSRLEYNEELNAELDEYAEANPEDGWFDIAEGFISSHLAYRDIKRTSLKARTEHWNENPYDANDADQLTVNTYNHDNVLDQVIQYTQVSYDGEATYPDFIVLQVHGGADVRGGYTKPVVFDSIGDDGCGLLSDNDCHISCVGQPVSTDPVLPGFDKPEIQYHSWSGYGGYFDPNDAEGDLRDAVANEDEDDKKLLCPDCNATLQAWIN